MGARALLLAGMLALTGAAGSAQTAAPPSRPTIPSPGSRRSGASGLWPGRVPKMRARSASCRATRATRSITTGRCRSSRRATASRPSRCAPTGSTISGRTPITSSGILRRTTLASYRTDTPQWETVLDVDALAARRGQDLGLSGHAMPAARRALLPGQPLRRRPRRQCRARVRSARRGASSMAASTCPKASRT